MASIGNNYTRYSTEGLQALLDVTIQACQDMPELADRWLRRKNETLSLEVAYWSGDPMGSRQWGSWGKTNEGAPWFVSPPTTGTSQRLLLLTPEKAVKVLNPVEALSLSGEEQSMPKEMKRQTALLMAARLGYRLRGSDYGMKKVYELLCTRPEICAVTIPVLKNLETKKEVDSREQIRRLWQTFRYGKVASDSSEALRQLRWGLHRYADLQPGHEKQRQRLLAKGEEVPELKTPVEVLEELLREYKAREEG